MISKASNNQNQHEQVFRAIEAELYKPLTATVGRRCGGTVLESDVEDIVQEAFSQLWQAFAAGCFPDVTIDNWRDKPHIERIRTRLFGGARYIRYAFYHRRTELQPFDGQTLIPAKADSCPFISRDIATAIQKCPRVQRDTFLLVHQGWSVAEIAAEQEVAAATVRSNYFRALRSLRKALKDYR